MAEEKKQPKPKGGFREGAGRKPKMGSVAKIVSVAIPQHLLDIINEHYDNRSDFIQKAIKEKLRRDELI